MESLKAYVNADALRLRNKPSLKAKTLAMMYACSEVEILEESGKWCKVYFNGTEGYCLREFLKLK